MNYIPINSTILNAHHTDCWAYFCYLRHSTTHTYCSFTPNSIRIKLTLAADGPSAEARRYADMGRTLWTEYKKNWETEQLLIIDTPTTMMPHHVFDMVYEKIITLPKRSRGTHLRLYLHMYYWCHRCDNDFGISIERLACELSSNTGLVCTMIQFFIDAGLLRRMGGYSAFDGRSYRYFIPIELESDIR